MTDLRQWGEDRKESSMTARYLHSDANTKIRKPTENAEGGTVKLRLPTEKSCVQLEDQVGERDLGVINTHGQTMRVLNYCVGTMLRTSCNSLKPFE